MQLCGRREHAVEVEQAARIASGSPSIRLRSLISAHRSPTPTAVRAGAPRSRVTSWLARSVSSCSGSSRVISAGNCRRCSAASTGAGSSTSPSTATTRASKGQTGVASTPTSSSSPTTRTYRRGPAVTGPSVLWAGIVTSWLAASRRRGGSSPSATRLRRRTGVVLAVLWGSRPTRSSSRWSLLGEPVHRALRVVAVRASAPAVADSGNAGLLAGTTVPAGVLVRGGRRRCVDRTPRGLAAWVAALLAPLGLLAYLAWVARPPTVGRLVLHAGQRLAPGVPRWLGDAAHARRQAAARVHALELYEVTAVLLVSAVLLVLLVFLRPPWPLLAYAAGLLVLTIGGAGCYHAKARFLLPAFRFCCRSRLRSHTRGCASPRRAAGACARIGVVRRLSAAAVDRSF